MDSNAIPSYMEIALVYKTQRNREGQVHGHLNINKFLIFIFSVINPQYRKKIYMKQYSIDH